MTIVAKKITPMMEQFFSIKKDYSDALLFYRMGDFYELFFEDAIKASEALNITLTSRGKHLEQKIPMCGVPVHSADNYLLSLIKKGFKVAVCEQMESPAEAKKRGYKAIVKRDVVRLVTPGTLTEESLLEAREYNFLCALSEIRGKYALAWVDISTGDFWVKSCEKTHLESLVSRLTPKEILVSENMGNTLHEMLIGSKATITPLSNLIFESTSAEERVCKLYKVNTLNGFGSFNRAEITAINAIIEYLHLTQKGSLPILKKPIKELTKNFLHIDSFTRKNLELTRSLSGEQRGSLLNTIDQTVTASGARLLESRLSNPSANIETIKNRQNDISIFLKNSGVRENIQKYLKNILDIERGLTRISLNRSGPRDIKAIGTGLMFSQKIFNELTKLKEPTSLSFGLSSLKGHKTIIDNIEKALVSNPPVNIKEGEFIKNGFDYNLDKHRMLRDQGKKVLAHLQQNLALKANISSLKIKHNNVLGYFVEVSARHSKNMLSPPLNEMFIHRQTTANSIRFTTISLGETESEIINAKNCAIALENRIFEKLQSDILQCANKILNTAKSIAEVDVICSLSKIAKEGSWCKPLVDGTRSFEVIDGRHPVVEQALRESSDNYFIPNNCNLSCRENDANIWLITGPNMAGKSTFLRQNALLVVLAQMGSYIPATSANIGIVTQLFSRVGASDDLARGHSTFMVEMVETAAILNQADERSLVILDEIGRGTATYDGLSIAWATLEYLHDKNKCRALFATHYHELASLSDKLPGLTNATVSVKEFKEEIVFLFKVVLGFADRSYGVQVAKLAGMPQPVLKRAAEVLNKLNSSDKKASSDKNRVLAQLPLFEKSLTELTPTPNKIHPIELKLKDIKPDEMSPIEALELIYILKESLSD